ncbi:type III-A CRISPR-associated RAMP protein Csm4 [Vulcanisaeta sp. JCM 14467]
MRVGYAIVRFLGPFRVGRTGLMDTLDYVPSDTVHSALENLTHMGIDHGIDRVSSMYPMAFTGSGGPVLTVPMPIDLKIQLLDLVSKKYVNDYSKIHTAIKRIKKLAYIPLDCLYEPDVDVDDGAVRVRCGGREYRHVGDYGVRVGIQRNVLGRVFNNADTYRVAAFQPIVDYVLYFTLREGADMGRARTALEVLGKVGIGGERSVGLGHFTVIDVSTIDYPWDSGSHALLLGTALPRRSEVIGCVNSIVRGWVCSNPFYVMGPISILTDGSVVHRDYLDFETLTGPNCVKRLDPLWLWYETRYQC